MNLCDKLDYIHIGEDVLSGDPSDKESMKERRTVTLTAEAKLVGRLNKWVENINPKNSYENRKRITF